MKALLVDDDADMLEAIGVGITFAWHDAMVLTAQTGQQGLRLSRQQAPDLVVLDVVLPDLSGFDVLRAIRRVSEVPVLMLAGQPTETDHVRSLDLGADAYIPKPFSILTLLARMRAILRRTGLRPADPDAQATRCGDLTIDFGQRQVWRAGQLVRLTPAEYRLLDHLARQPNRVLSNQVLCERVWGHDWQATAKDLKALVHRVRAKLGEDPRQPHSIETQRGLG
jgi:DNA-binding response OmpR family regulator